MISMSEIRVGYSALISLVIGLASTIIGMVFVLIITRTVTPLDYGSWGLISGFLLYAGVVEPIISVWVLREIARGKDSGKTAVLSSGLFSIIGISIYLLVVFFIGPQTDATQNLLYFGVILIPTIFLNRILTAINSAWKPQAASYGQLIFGITEVIVALVLVYFLNLGLMGIILSITSAFLLSSLTQIIFGRNKLKAHFQIQYLKKWIKLSWLALFPTLSGAIIYFDIVIFSIITGSVIGLAYWSAAFAITGMITGISLITRPTYSKLLFEGEGKNFLSENLRQLFYFGIPVVSLIIVFAKPGIFILNPIYELAVPIVIILSIQVFLGVLNRNFQELITGVEKVDVEKNATLKNFLKSNLFLMPTILLIKNSSYVILLAVGMSFFISETLFEQLMFWALLSLFVQTPFTIYVYLLMKKELDVSICSNNISKYIIASIGSFGFTYLLMENYLTYSNDIFILIPNVLIYAIIGIFVYVFTTYIIDHKTRVLIKYIFTELKSNK
jgi:O-antigen/teichoic acid export membrane protein